MFFFSVLVARVYNRLIRSQHSRETPPKIESLKIKTAEMDQLDVYVYKLIKKNETKSIGEKS